MAPEKTGFILPVAIVGAVDLSRLQREIEKLQGDLQAQSIRVDSNSAMQLPKLSLLLEQFVQTNKLDLLKLSDREQAVQFLSDTKKDAPKIHLSFSADPSPQFMQKLTIWLRQNIHPTLLITIGLQPGIGAGCVLRTPNKYFDLSLGKSLADKRELLMQQLQAQETTA